MNKHFQTLTISVDDYVASRLTKMSEKERNEFINDTLTLQLQFDESLVHYDNQFTMNSIYSTESGLEDDDQAWDDSEEYRHENE